MRLALSLAGLALLAGCASAPKPGAPARPGYYLDDGPPPSPPPDVSAIPDAVPRDEPFHRGANRPYTVFGQTYAPFVNNDPFAEQGVATWYGRRFHGKPTAIGETYDMFAMTAAHRTMPLPSYAKVTNLKNGRSVVVRVNDRGPFVDGRVIDLSWAAAMKIGMPGSGPVRVERVFARDVPALLAAAPPQPKAATVVTPVLTGDAATLYLQLGAFSSLDNARQFRDRVAHELPWLAEPPTIALQAGLHRVRVGPYATREAAQAAAERIQSALAIAPLITNPKP